MDTVESIKIEILELPNQILKSQQEVLNLMEEIEISNSKVKEKELKTKADVLGMKGNPEFGNLSNETLRSIKEKEMLASDDMFNLEVAVLKKLQKTLREKELVVDNLKTKLRAWETFARL